MFRRAHTRSSTQTVRAFVATDVQALGATVGLSTRTVQWMMVVLMDPMEDPDDVLRANRSREKTYLFDVAFDYSASQCGWLFILCTANQLSSQRVRGGLRSGFLPGCGKTYTMLGTDKEPGIYVRTLNDLFRAIEETSDDMLYSVSMSYLEIYNEMIRDLLNPSSGFLDLREDSKGVIQVAGITEVSTINAQEIMELLVKGNRQRTQEPTAANQTSSRSHALLQVCVKQQSRSPDLQQEVRYGRLFMIDLAGSERAAQRPGLKEGAHINRSLLALGNCINALSDKNGQNTSTTETASSPGSQGTGRCFRPGLDLDSLGGNSRTVMIAHISPASTAFEESRNTLTYADRAKSIRTRVKKNLLNVTYHIAQYTSIIADLRGEIQRLQRKSASRTEVQAHSSHQSRAEVERLREQLLQGFREQMEIRRNLVELENSNMELQVETSRHLLTIADWEQERSRRRRKWKSEQQKESDSKDESEKDWDSSESAPDSSETQEVSRARENLLLLMSEQKRHPQTEDHSLLVPPQLQQLYDTYMKEADERRLERVLALDTARYTVKEGSLPKISLPVHSRDQTLDLDSDQESLRNVRVERGQSRTRRHTLPPILPEPDLDNNRVFKNSPHAQRIKNSSVVTPPPIHINGKNRELQPLVPDSFLSYSLLSHSVSSHLDSSPESSEAGAELTHSERDQILKGVQNIVVKAARRRSRALESDSLRFPPASPLDPHKQRNGLSLSAAPPAGAPLRRRQPSPELTHATSDDNLSSSTGDAPQNHHVTKTRSKAALKNQTPRDTREGEVEGRRRKRRSRSFEVTGQAVPQTKSTAAQRFRPLDSTSDPHLHIGAPPAALRAQRGAAGAGRGRAAPPGNLHTGPGAESAPLSNLKRVPQLRPQPLLYINSSNAQRPRRN
ncbi:hypothetical protein WMY93_009981 [Mugilogobius chulae]|uniref:Kinesin-like protein n=1 Tax=Mugilogobius chulae TaxID=88201 RepID=A0AAW0P5R9_9GOBI